MCVYFFPPCLDRPFRFASLYGTPRSSRRPATLSFIRPTLITCFPPFFFERPAFPLCSLFRGARLGDGNFLHTNLLFPPIAGNTVRCSTTFFSSCVLLPAPLVSFKFIGIAFRIPTVSSHPLPIEDSPQNPGQHHLQSEGLSLCCRRNLIARVDRVWDDHS